MGTTIKIANNTFFFFFHWLKWTRPSRLWAQTENLVSINDTGLPFDHDLLTSK